MTRREFYPWIVLVVVLIVIGILLWFVSIAIDSRLLQLFIPVFFVGLLFIIISYWLRGRLFQKNQKVWSGRPIVRQALNLLCENLTGLSNERFRAALFLQSNPDETSVKIAFHSPNMTGALDSDIEFRKGQGCVGLVWDDPHFIVANLADPDARRGAKWGLTKRQIDITRDLQSVACVPIYKPDDENCMLAILSVDCNNEVADFLSSEVVKQILSEASGSLGKILSEIGLTEPLS